MLRPELGTIAIFLSFRIQLSSEKFVLGRASSCDYSITESNMGGMMWFNTVSKVQCEIYRSNNDIFITDCSSNGNPGCLFL